MTEYFGRVIGNFSAAMDAGINVRFIVGHRGECPKKIVAAYLSEHPLYGGQVTETALIVAWAENLPPRAELMSDEPIADLPRVIPDAMQREGLPPRPNSNGVSTRNE
jgi:hypothetical protein